MSDWKEAPGDARLMWNRTSVLVSLLAIILYLSLHYGFHVKSRASVVPLWIAVIVGGVPLLYDLSRQVLKRQFGSYFLAGLSIVTATLMGELLVATIIVLMLSGGQALEEFATKRASSVLNELAKRMPSVAHRIVDGTAQDIAVTDIDIGDRLILNSVRASIPTNE